MSNVNTPAVRYYNVTTQQFEEQTGQGGESNVALYAWSTNLLQNIALSVDNSGNLNVTGGGGGGGAVTQGTVPWVVQSFDNYDLRFDAAATPVLYLGEAVAGSASSASVWRIQRIDTTSGVVIQWANGANTFANIWDNRASLPYS